MQDFLGPEDPIGDGIAITVGIAGQLTNVVYTAMSYYNQSQDFALAFKDLDQAIAAATS